MIQRAFIERLLDRADIVEVVTRSGVELRKAGRDFVACCPFHSEKTPSFHVSPSRQTWHCFGQCQEGGNAIGYIMRREGVGFVEAVKRLASMVGVEMEETEETAQEQAARLKKDRLRSILRGVQEFYASLLRGQDKGAKAARSYAVARWGEDYCGEMGLGYAPAAWDTLARHAREEGWPDDLLIELGLLRRSEKDGRVFDFFRDRLMIPIRTRSRQVAGFTARDMGSDPHSPKYINSPASPVYKKGEMVWGLDTASHEAARQEKFYIVEGAADAMKMQAAGIDNVVAPLGGALTEAQLLLLKKTAKAVCFINDADPLRPDETDPLKRWGAGIAYVVKNGELALCCGLMVSVRELPVAEGNQKQDPGSFFTSADMLQRLPEEDFITWAAGKLFSKDDAPAAQTGAVRRVAEMLSHITDDLRLEMILPDVAKRLKGTRRDWLRSLVNKLRWERQQGDKKKEDGVDLRQYGFYEEHGRDNFGYWSQSEKGGDVQWTNFTMRPLFHIKSEDKPLRLFYLKNEKGREDIVEMTMEDLNSPAKFRAKIEGVGNYLWMGNDRDMVRLKRYLYDQTETASIVRQLGWNSAGFYAWGNGIWASGDFTAADEFGIVRLEGKNWYIPAASRLYAADPLSFERERKFVHLRLQEVQAGDYLQKFAAVYGDNGRIGLMYWVASLFRDIVVSHTDKFPLLDLFGPKGSGKSQMAAALMSFFVTGYKAPNIQSATPAALSYEVAATSNALCHIDEYKNDIDARRIDFLKGLYDGAGRMKMGGASYDKVEMTSVKTGIILSGQELPTADIALFHRCVFLSFPKSEFSPEEKARFDELRAVQRLGLSSITLEVLALRKKFEASFRDVYALTTSDINAALRGQSVETRLLENWAKVLASFRCVEDNLRWPMTYAGMLHKVTAMLIRQNKMSGAGNELSKFWEMVQYLHDEGKIYEEGDYQIRLLQQFDTDTGSRDLTTPIRVLFLNPSRVFALYKMAMLHTGSKPLPEDALREYLKNAPSYLGRKSARFKFIIDGVEQKVGSVAPGQDNHKYSPRRALLFNYDTITAQHGISLDSETAQPTPPAEPLPF